MTYEEYCEIMDNGNFFIDSANPYDMEIKKALEKQIPKKPIPIQWEQYKDKIINAEYLRGGYWCPNCKHMIKSGEYCVDCGQKLDWGMKNDGTD